MITVIINIVLLIYINSLLLYQPQLLQVIGFQRRKAIEFNRTVAGGVSAS